MSEQATGNGTAALKQRELIMELHLKRSGEVRLAREIRECGMAARDAGVPADWTCGYNAQWEKVEALTGQIELAELELKALESGRDYIGQACEALKEIDRLDAFQNGLTMGQIRQLVCRANVKAHEALDMIESYARGEVANG